MHIIGTYITCYGFYCILIYSILSTGGSNKNKKFLSITFLTTSSTHSCCVPSNRNDRKSKIFGTENTRSLQDT